MSMDHKKIDSGIDRAAESAKETVDLLAGRIDAVSRCAQKTRLQAEDRLKEKVLHVTDVVEEQVGIAADRIREKVKGRR